MSIQDNGLFVGGRPCRHVGVLYHIMPIVAEPDNVSRRVCRTLRLPYCGKGADIRRPLFVGTKLFAPRSLSTTDENKRDQFGAAESTSYQLPVWNRAGDFRAHILGCMSFKSSTRNAMVPMC
jgi:hypothetical protein